MVETDKSKQEFIKKSIEGKSIKSLKYIENYNYWVMLFSDNTFTQIRFLSECI